MPLLRQAMGEVLDVGLEPAQTGRVAVDDHGDLHGSAFLVAAGLRPGEETGRRDGSACARGHLSLRQPPWSIGGE